MNFELFPFWKQFTWGGEMDKLSNKKLEESLKREFERWDHLYKYGGSDPNWEDGTNLYLVRNHIINYRREMDSRSFFPEIYKREVPPNVPMDYMARKSEIKENALKTLRLLKSNSDYKWLVLHEKELIDNKCTLYALHYVYGLETAIDINDYVTMRRYERTEFYSDSLKQQKASVLKIMIKTGDDTNIENKLKIEESGQMSLIGMLG